MTTPASNLLVPFVGTPPPLRRNDQPDADDGRRIEFVHALWRSQDAPLQQRDRQIEENIRMLAGQQWSVYSQLLGRWVDVTQWMTEQERRWRQRPVFNRLLPWFILTHAKLTENPPVLTFVPGPDRIDAELAETMDVIFKTTWRDIGMTDVVDRLMAWLIPAGRAYLQSRVDLTRGDLEEWRGYAELPMMGQEPMEGQEPELMGMEGVPFDRDGNPIAQLTPDGLQTMTGPDGQPMQPHSEREGELVVDVLSPLEVRGQWGPTPWHLKRWHMVRSFLTPEEVRDTFGVDVPADVSFEGYEGTEGEMMRMLFGSGYYSSSSPALSTGHVAANAARVDGLCEVTTYWRAPSGTGELAETQQSPGGRLLICTRSKVLRDTIRPVRYPYTSPIRCFEFVRLPGRPQGTSPQDALNSPQRAYNRGWAQLIEHRNLCTNPKTVVDAQSGLGKIGVTNQPGEVYEVTRRPGVPPIEFVAPPSLSDDVYRVQALLSQEIEYLGQTSGQQGEPPTPDASGELVKELRFNTDRFLGPTVRRAVEEFARLAEDWIALLPTIYDTEKLISYAGEDNVARTITVLPMMFTDGVVNVVPDVESMLPEGRGERQVRIYRMYMDGLFGLPGSPEALKRFFELSRFPHLARTAKPGGVHRVTAEQENGKLLQGMPAQQIPLFDWYDDIVHLEVLDGFMASPEFLRVPPEVQSEFALHRLGHLANAQRKMLEQQMQMAEAAAIAAGPMGAAPGGGGNGGPSARSSVQPQPAAAPRSTIQQGIPQPLAIPQTVAKP